MGRIRRTSLFCEGGEGGERKRETEMSREEGGRGRCSKVLRSRFRGGTLNVWRGEGGFRHEERNTDFGYSSHVDAAIPISTDKKTNKKREKKLRLL